MCVYVCVCLCACLGFCVQISVHAYFLIAIIRVPVRDFSWYRKYKLTSNLVTVTVLVQSSYLLLVNLFIVLIFQNHPYLMLNKDENTSHVRAFTVTG